ncbi:hypothetical protein PF003_g40866 [Phytophthora fragariae]|nr:hypothetical protein PF003_g40866 [Phytophthora fragariae]KAE8926019.1 hypothetical protein PF009_g23784 [Phytophthora fragariae]
MVGTRGTTPHEENPAAPDEERGTINFKAVWSGFKAAGWTSKPPPRGIGTLWKYILPGRDANGAEGVDYLLGKQAVVNHAVQLALQERAERASAAPPVGAAAEDSPALPTKDTGAAAGASAASATEDPPASDDLFPAASTSDHEPEEGTPSPRPTRRTTSPKQTKSTKATKQPKLTKATKQPKPSKVSSAKPPKPTKKPTRKASASKPRTSSARHPLCHLRPLCHRRLGQFLVLANLHSQSVAARTGPRSTGAHRVRIATRKVMKPLIQWQQVVKAQTRRVLKRQLKLNKT